MAISIKALVAAANSRRPTVIRGVDQKAMMIDSQSSKTTEAGRERGFDGGKQVTGRKRQLVVDTAGN